MDDMGDANQRAAQTSGRLVLLRGCLVPLCPSAPVPQRPSAPSAPGEPGELGGWPHPGCGGAFPRNVDGSTIGAGKR